MTTYKTSNVSIIHDTDGARWDIYVDGNLLCSDWFGPDGSCGNSISFPLDAVNTLVGLLQEITPKPSAAPPTQLSDQALAQCIIAYCGQADLVHNANHINKVIDVIDLARAPSQRIEAIKLLLTRTQCPLAVAKDALDKYVPR